MASQLLLPRCVSRWFQVRGHQKHDKWSSPPVTLHASSWAVGSQLTQGAHLYSCNKRYIDINVIVDRWVDCELKRLFRSRITLKLLITGPFGWSMVSAYKGPVMWKAFQCQGYIMEQMDISNAHPKWGYTYLIWKEERRKSIPVKITYNTGALWRLLSTVIN